MPTYDDGTCNTLTADWHAPAIAFNGTQTPTSEEEFSPAMTHEGAAVMHVATQYGDEVAGTLTARHDSSPCADRGQNVVCLADDNANAALDVDMCGSLKVGGGSVRSYASNGEEVIGSLCARDYNGVGNEYVGEGKVICQRRTS